MFDAGPTSVIILVDSPQPADVIMSVGNEMHIQHAILANVAVLNNMSQSHNRSMEDGRDVQLCHTVWAHKYNYF